MIHVDRSVLRSLLVSVGLASIAFFGIASAGAQTLPAVSRITQAIDETNLVTLKGNTHPLARPQYDQGPAPDNMPAERILLLLRRSPAQETALHELMDGQKSKSSPYYQQWLTPTQFGQQFGPSDSDIQTITSWLTSHGFSVNRVSAGRTIIEFSGNAGEVREAFHTQIHKYMVNGQSHWANSTDPQIPAALAAVVAGPVTLHNFGRKAMHVVAGKINAPTAAVAADTAKPALTAECGGAPCYLVGPADFSTIYNTAPLWTASIDGTGQTIAIVGDSNIVCSDVTNFRNFFGLPVSAAQSSNDCTQATSNVQVILNGPDPGLTGDEIEADLDVQWSGAVAKGAHIDFVASESTEVSQGVDLSAEYIVDNDLAPVMSESFGSCEGELETGGNNYYSSLWEQAAAEGITVMVSAGDSGAAGCDDDNSEIVSEYGLAVSGISSTPFNVSVGGTDFDDFTTQSTYWNPAPNGGYTPGTSQQSVKGYVPEIPWDDSCAADSLTGCAGLTESSAAVNIVAGGGGQSNCTAVNNANNCTSFYARPSWQKGPAVTTALATQAGGPRNVPDVALFAAAGSGSNSFYPICESDLNNGNAACTAINDFTGVGGTSSSSPAFAGIMAMVNQYMLSQGKPARQGNANYELYTLAGNQVTTPPAGGCNSTSTPNVTNTSGCTFYDITIDSNSVPCIEGYGCTISNVNATSPGVLEEVNELNNTAVSPATLAWQAGTGYDMSTGLGSVNAFNLAHNWPMAVGNFTPTATTLKLCAGSPQVCISSGTGGTLSLVHGAAVTVTTTVAPNPGVGTPTGDVSLIGTPNTLANNDGSSNAGVDYFTVSEATDDVANLDVLTLSGGTKSSATNDLVGGNYAVTAYYTGDGTFGASNSPAAPAVNVNVSAEPSSTTVTVEPVNPSTGDFTNSTAYGLVDLVRVDVVGASGEENTSGNVNMTDNNVAIGCPAACTLNTEGNLEIQAGVNVVPTLTTGAHSFQAAFQGNASYAASTSTKVAFTVTPATTSTSVLANPTSVTAGQNTVLTATVSTDSIGVAPTGTVTFFANGSAISGTVTYVRTPGSLLGAPGTGVGAALASVTATLTYTTAALPPPAPLARPDLRGTPLTWIVGAMAAILAILLSLALPERRRGYAFLVLVLLAVGGATVACGGGGSGGGGGGPTGVTITAMYNASGDTNYASSALSAGAALSVMADAMTSPSSITAAALPIATPTNSSSPTLTVQVSADASQAPFAVVPRSILSDSLAGPSSAKNRTGSPNRRGSRPA